MENNFDELNEDLKVEEVSENAEFTSTENADESAEYSHYIEECLPILNLYRHHILYKRAVTKRKMKMAVSMAMFFVVCLTTFALNFIFTDYGKLVQTTISYNYNPVNPLYSDTGHIVFTGNFAMQKYNVEKPVDFALPMITNEFEIVEGQLVLKHKDSLMVVASADGVVLEVGNLASGGKYIVIKHSKHISTRYENVHITGVVVGDEVKAGKEIASVKDGETLRFSVLKDNKVVAIKEVSQNKVVWENLN